MNLATNAIKFTNEEYVALGYEVVEVKQQIKFTVKHTSLGIDKNNKQHIFDHITILQKQSTEKNYLI